MNSRTFVALVVLAIAGCNSDPGADIDTVPIEGTLKIDDKPYGPATLLVVPEPPSKDRMDAEGTVDKDGSFTLKTRGTFNGAPEGKYKVTIDGGPELEDKDIIIEIKRPSGGGAMKLVIEAKTKKGSG